MKFVITIFQDEDGMYIAECPSIPGCISQGKTKPEAIDNIREAIEGWIETASAHHQPIPDEDFETQVVCV